MEVTSSGRLVPMAMIVSPISVWLSPRLDAIEDAPSTTKLSHNRVRKIYEDHDGDVW